jgi:hypothetical protein
MLGLMSHTAKNNVPVMNGELASRELCGEHVVHIGDRERPDRLCVASLLQVLEL